MPIDNTRPLMTRKHPDGYWVHMYQDEPGVYYAQNGQVYEEEEGLEQAHQAGFEVLEFAKARRRAELLEEQRIEVEKRIEEEFKSKLQDEEAKIERKFAGKIEKAEKEIEKAHTPGAALRTPKKEDS